MKSYPSLLTAVLVAGLSSLQAPAADRLIVFPTASSPNAAAFTPSTLTPAGAFEIPSGAFEAFQSIGGEKLYVVTRRSEGSVLVLDGQTLALRQSIDLGQAPFDAALTPDGQRLLVAAASLRVIDTSTDEETSIPTLSSAPTQIVVDDASERAYVLAGTGLQVDVIDLEALERLDSVEVNSANSIALSDDGAFLLVGTTDGVARIRTADLVEVERVETEIALVNPQLHPIPGTNKLFIENRGGGTLSTSQVLDLGAGTVQNVGQVGGTSLIKTLIINSDLAVGLLRGNGGVALFDLTAEDDIPADEIEGIDNANDIAASPDGHYVFATSLVNGALYRADVETGALDVLPLPIQPSALAAIFDPTAGSPANIQILGGDSQYLPPGETVQTPLSVRVTDAEGRPAANVPVLFEDASGLGFTFLGDASQTTNLRGVATVRAVVPPAPPTPDPEEGDEQPEQPEQAEQPEPLQTASIAATAAGVGSVLFDVNVVRGTGLIKISGDRQLAAQNTLFPLELRALATDLEGNLLPPGTKVNFAASRGSCGDASRPGIGTLDAEVDLRGFVTLVCSAGITDSNFLADEGSVIMTALVPSLDGEGQQEGVSTSFDFTLVASDPGIRIEKVAGDQQTGRTGQPLPEPLEIRLPTRAFGGGRVGVEIRQISGPAATIEPRRLEMFVNSIRSQQIDVTLGPSSGSLVIEVRANAPGLPTERFTITAVGGRAVRLDKVAGDGQSGRIGSTLPQALEVRVVNESGQPIAFPTVNWQVLEGPAAVAVTPQGVTSQAAVTLGDQPGPVRIAARVGALEQVFTVTAQARQPVAINQHGTAPPALLAGDVSAPLTVRIVEADGAPAVGTLVTFSAPPTVLLHPAGGVAAGNPVQIPADAQGLAAVRAELLGSSNDGPAIARFPEQISGPVAITAMAGPGLAYTFLLNVTGRTPIFTVDSVVNAASGQPGLTPGGIASIFGSGLADGLGEAGSPNGATSFGGVVVRVGGVPTPLLAISPDGDQINFQTPFQTPSGQVTTVEVENNGSITRVSGVPVFPAQPGIFWSVLDDGERVPAVAHLDGALVTAANPATPGEILSVYFTGGGGLETPVAAGQPGPAPAVDVVSSVVVGVDDKGAERLFAGYAPGALGLYQANFLVPEDVSCGGDPVALSVRVADAFSQTESLAVSCQ